MITLDEVASVLTVVIEQEKLSTHKQEKMYQKFDQSDAMKVGQMDSWWLGRIMEEAFYH